MKRLIEKDLLQWKQKVNKKPLIIQGARQVGKTTTVKNFGNDHYKNFVEINFERQLEFVELFNHTRNPKDLLDYFQLTFLDVEFNQDTLLLLDEIQACPSALTALKFLGEQFHCDIIATGSLLGIAIEKTSSYPVGYVETMQMNPMNFIEFIMALGIPDRIIEEIKVCVNEIRPIPAAIHDKMNELFKSYIIVGGMPEVVLEYVNHKSYRNTLLKQRQLVNDYANDIAKYASSSDKIKAKECFDSIPLQLAKENKKFQYKLLKKGGNARIYESSLQWLESAGTICKVNRLNTIAQPLEDYKDNPVFKIYYLDTGLLMSNFNENFLKELIQGNGDLVYKGAVYENIAAQILCAHHKKMYYFEPNTTTEIDFVINYKGNIVPLEIKSGDNTRSKSLNSFVEKYQSKIAYRFSTKNISKKENIYYYPLYTLDFVLSEEPSIL